MKEAVEYSHDRPVLIDHFWKMRLKLTSMLCPMVTMW